MSSSHGEENKQCLNSYPKGDEEGEGEGEEGKEKEKKKIITLLQSNCILSLNIL